MTEAPSDELPPADKGAVQASPSPARSRPRRMLLGAGSVLVVWGVLELVCALVLLLFPAPQPSAELLEEDPQWLINAKEGWQHGFLVTDQHTIWRAAAEFVEPPTPLAIWGDQPLILNKHGHRSPDFATPKPPGVRRIMLLGGSHPFGMWVNTPEAYVSVIGQQLEAREPGRWEVINAACPGHTTFQGLRYLEHYGLAFEPDIVLFDLGTNDDLPLSIDYAVPDHKVMQVPGSLDRATRIARFSRVYRLLLRAVAPLAAARESARVRVPLEQRVQYLEAVGDLGQEHGFEVLYMSQVAAEQVGPGGTTKCLYSPDEFEPVADVCGLFAQLGTQAGAYFHDPVHADARGHRMIGEYVLQRLDELGWTK